MNKYSFKDIHIDMEESFKITITKEEMNIFANLSGDYNPMHMDNEFAEKRGYNSRIVYGMLAASYYSRLVGMYLPGENCLLNKCDVTFKSPVYIDDSLLVKGRVYDIREGTQRVKIKATMMNQKGTIVNSAEIIVSFTNEKDA